MSKMSKAILALGVVAGLGVATLPLGAYADETTVAAKYNQSAQAQVQVEVGGAISITVDNGATESGADKSLVDLGQLKINGISTTKDINVIVSSNSEIGYDLTIKSATPETALVNEKGAKIPANANVAEGTSAWAYKLANAYGTDGEDGYIPAGAWQAITNTAVQIGGGQTSTSGEGTNKTDTTVVTFGASANGTQQEGTYTGTVVFTATVK